MVLLLGFTSAVLDHEHIYKECWAIIKGIKKYDKEFHIKHPEIGCFYQLYHENMIYRNREISFEMRTKTREIKSFDQYYELLTDVLSRIRNNYGSPLRKIPMTPFTTLSSGYDTTAVATLVKDIGVKVCFTSKYSNSSIPSCFNKLAAVDDGTKTADVLKLQAMYLGGTFSTSIDDELYYLAPSWEAFGTVFQAMNSYIEEKCKAAVVFVGHNGDILWDVNVDKKHLNDEMVPGDLGGIHQSEIRLKSGIIQVSIPYIFARNVVAINKISSSDEMGPWRLNNAYDRPIARRIAEDAGVPRGFFGQRNKAVAKHYYFPKNRRLRKEFFQFLKKHYNMRPTSIYARLSLNTLVSVLSRVLTYITHFRHEDAITSGMRVGVVDAKISFFKEDITLYHAMFVWAANTLSAKMAYVLNKNRTSL